MKPSEPSWRSRRRSMGLLDRKSGRQGKELSKAEREKRLREAEAKSRRLRRPQP